MDVGILYESAFGPRSPLPPKVASPSWELTESLNLDSYATNPKAKHDTGTRSTESFDDDDSRAPRQPDAAKYGKNELERATEHFEETATPHGTKATPTAVSTTLNDSRDGQVSESKVQPRTTSSNSQGGQASGSKAENTTRTVEPFSILHAMMTVTDIFDILMLSCPDFSTLFSLVVSCKTAKKAFEDHSQGVIKAMLKRLPDELQHLTVALIAFNKFRARNPMSIRQLMQTWLSIDPMPVMDQFANPVQTLRKLAHVFTTIDLFTDVIATNCVDNIKDYKTVVASRIGLHYGAVTQWSNKHPLLNQTEWSDIPDDTEWEVGDLPDEVEEFTNPPTDRENYRIKRALLRYELFCSLFRLRPDKYFDTRHHPHRHHHIPDVSVRRVFLDEQKIFFQQYVNPWEIGEMAVIAQFVFDVVRNAYFHKYKSLRYDEAYKSWYTPYYNRYHGKNRHDDHEAVVDEFHNHIVWHTSQGLNIIRGIYEDRKESYSKLTEKYGNPRYRIAGFFLPFAKIAQQGWPALTMPSPSSWNPRHRWRGALGMELPSKGWLDKSPPVDDAYWGEKWTRKIGLFIWDRD